MKYCQDQGHVNHRATDTQYSYFDWKFLFHFRPNSHVNFIPMLCILMIKVRGNTNESNHKRNQSKNGIKTVTT